MEHFSREPGRGYVSVVSLYLTSESYCAVYFNGCCYANCNYVSPEGSFKFHHFALSHLQERIVTTFLAASHFKVKHCYILRDDGHGLISTHLNITYKDHQ